MYVLGSLPDDTSCGKECEQPSGEGAATGGSEVHEEVCGNRYL